MKWSPKEKKYPRKDEVRITPVFTWWPRKASYEVGNHYSNSVAQKRWLTFSLLSKKYRPANTFNYTNMFGAKRASISSGFWGSPTWDDSRKLTVKEKLYALIIALRNASLALGIVGGLTCVFAFSIHEVYRLGQEIKNANAEYSQFLEDQKIKSDALKKRPDESLEQLNQ